MASLSLTHLSPMCRWSCAWQNHPLLFFVHLQDFRLQHKWGLAAISRKKTAQTLPEEGTSGNHAVVKKKTTRTLKQGTSRTRKKSSGDTSENDSKLVSNTDTTSEENLVALSSDNSKKKSRARQKVASTSSSSVEETSKKRVRRRRKTVKTDDGTMDQAIESETSELEEYQFMMNAEDESDIDLGLDNDNSEDISYTYGWPPLVCCFGAAQHAFVPSGRPANRLIDYELHERLKDALWEPEKFVRAPGGSAGSVAIALASLGGKVAFMGKLGDDTFGQAMLYYMNVNNVQTRSVRIDSRRRTAVSYMKIAKRGRLRATCVKPCAEDSLPKSDVNIDVLKEAKMFYFSTHSLLDQNMRATTLRAIKISKKLGGVIFFDVNLPLPLWHSSEQTKLFIQQWWKLANIIEVTKQELEFLCGIVPTEEFDTRNNVPSKFIHYEPEVVAPLWHDNLKVLFVTNGTSKIHYYTSEHNGAVHGMEDAPLSPFTGDMSASGDGIVAAIMRMLSVQPHLITDKRYLELTIKYAIDCGVIDQWLLGRARGYPPRDDEEEEVEPDINGIRSITEKEYRTLKRQCH